MNVYVPIFFCLIVYAVSADDPRIVGGKEVRDRTYFAYQVSIRYRNGHFCGGTILNEQHVITAAHCCFDKRELLSAKHLTVVVGDLKIYSKSNTTQVHRVRNIFTHEDYEPTTLANDIAILRIYNNFTINDYVKPLNLSQRLPLSGTQCVTSGWGKFDENSEIVSPSLYFIITPILDYNECAKSYMFGLKEGMFCAGYMKGGKDSCQGDSGGPLVCDQILTGIISWGDGCARKNRPGVYTDVAKYLDWISREEQRSSAKALSLSIIIFLITLFNFFYLYYY